MGVRGEREKEGVGRGGGGMSGAITTVARIVGRGKNTRFHRPRIPASTHGESTGHNGSTSFSVDTEKRFCYASGKFA